MDIFSSLFDAGITHAAVWAACCSFISHNTDAALRPSAQGVLQVSIGSTKGQYREYFRSAQGVLQVKTRSTSGQHREYFRSTQ
jgi:hypothetical protein